MCCLLKSEHKNKVKPAVICILLLVSFVFGSMSVKASGDVKRAYGEIVQMRSSNPFLNVEHVTAMLEKRNLEDEDIKYIAWSQDNGITLENDSLGTNVRLDRALYYYGDNYGIFNLILDNGCALSKDAAFKIFGTTERILGETVMINGERYIVEKWLYDNTVPLIYKIKEENARADFDVLDIIPREKTAFSLSEICMNFGINSDIVIDYGDVIKSVTNPFYISDSFIPTRWSEFEFWSSKFTQFGDTLKYYFSMKAYAPDLVFRSYIFKILIFASISVVSIIFAAVAGHRIIKERRIKMDNPA